MHRVDWNAVWITAAVSFALFAWMADPGVSWMDPGELIAAGYALGGAHPPGHPAHTLIAKLATFIPVGDIAFRVNLVSAVAMAIAVAGVVALVHVFIRNSVVLGYGTALFVVLAPLPQINATRAEVYAPTVALLTWAGLAIVLFIRRQGNGKLALLAALASGCAAAFHPVIALAATIPFTGALLWRLRARIVPLFFPLAIVGSLGILTYSYLPLRAIAEHRPLFIWGDPTTLGGFVDLLFAKAYQGNFAWKGFVDRFVELMILLSDGMGLGIVLGGLVGLCFGVVTSLAGTLVLLVSTIFVITGAATQQQLNPDMAGYVVLAVFFLAPGVAIFASGLMRLIVPKEGESRWWYPWAAVGMLVPVFAMGMSGRVAHAKDAGFRRGDDVYQLWEDTVAKMPPGPGLFIANSDHLLFGAMYHRLVTGGRPDIALVHTDLCRDAWFLAFVKRSVPSLWVPYVDDGKRGQIAKRLVLGALQRGMVVGSDAFFFPDWKVPTIVPRGRGFSLSLVEERIVPGGAPPPPPEFVGDIGMRIARRIGLVRASYEATMGKFGAAVVAAGIHRFGGGEVLEHAVFQPDRPSLLRWIPRPPVLISEPWEVELFADDLAWRVGFDEPSLAKETVLARHLHRLWRRVVSEDLQPGARSIRSLSFADQLATVYMLLGVGRADLAESQLVAMRSQQGDSLEVLMLLGSLVGNREGQAAVEAAEQLFRRATQLAPNHAEAFVRLGVCLAKQDRMAEARDAWKRALAIQPSRRDVATWLQTAP